MANSSILKDLASALGLSINAFEKQIGAKTSSISVAVRRDSAIKESTIERIIKTFPLVNPDFLKTGEGAMFRKAFTHDTTPIAATGAPFTNKTGTEFEDLGNGFYRMNVQLVSQKSAAGYLSGWGDQEYLEELPFMSIIVKQPHKGTYRAFEIAANNDSMDDGTKRSIEAGDIVIDRLINRSLWSSSKLHLNQWKVYTIVHRFEGITTKEITHHDVENGLITCHSWNPDKKKYPDFQLQTDDIIQIWNVVKLEKNL